MITKKYKVKTIKNIKQKNITYKLHRGGNNSNNTVLINSNQSQSPQTPPTPPHPPQTLQTLQTPPHSPQTPATPPQTPATPPQKPTYQPTEQPHLDSEFMTKEYLLNALVNNIYIKNLINSTFSNVTRFNYSNDINVEDPFLTTKKPNKDKFNLDNLYDWYKTKNPNFVMLNYENNFLKIKTPEFSFITAIIVKDLIFLQKTKNFPKNDTNAPKQSNYNAKINTNKNDTHINTLLTMIDKFIKDEYLYEKFLEILSNYLNFFATGEVPEVPDERIHYFTYKDCLNQPYIIYPLIKELNYTQILYTIPAPVIFLKISNKQKINYTDILSQSINIKKKMPIHNTHNTNNTNNIHNKYINLFNKLKKYINYTDTDTDTKKLDNYSKQLFAYILYYIYKIDAFSFYNSFCNFLYNIIQNLPVYCTDYIFYNEPNILPAATYIYNYTQKKNPLSTELHPFENNSKTILQIIINYILITYGHILGVRTNFAKPKHWSIKKLSRNISKFIRKHKPRFQSWSFDKELFKQTFSIPRKNRY